MEQFSSYFAGLIDRTLGRAVVFVSCGAGIPVMSEDGVVQEVKLESADLFCSLLLTHIRMLKVSGLLRRKLHIQVDGGSAARSFNLFLLCGLLIALGWVEDATVASLIPGHTHVDVDALFSVFWKKYRSGIGRRARTWTEIKRVLSDAYPGWQSRSSEAKIPVKIEEVSVAWKFSKLFNREPSSGFKTCLNKDMKGIFGKGTEDGPVLQKPHKFVLASVDGKIICSSHKSSSIEAASDPANVVRSSTLLFSSCPDLSLVETHDLNAAFEFEKARVLSSFPSGGKLAKAGITASMVTEYNALSFKQGHIIDPFLLQSESHWSKYEEFKKVIGPPQPKGVRSAPQVMQVEESSASSTSDDDDSEGIIYEVSRILGKKKDAHTGKWVYQVLCKGFEHLPPDEINSSDMGEGSMLEDFNEAFEAERSKKNRRVEVEAFSAFKDSMNQRQKDTECPVCQKLFLGLKGLKAHRRMSQSCNE